MTMSPETSTLVDLLRQHEEAMGRMYTVLTVHR